MNRETKKLLVKIAVVGGLSLAESYLRNKLATIKEEEITKQLNDIREDILKSDVMRSSTLTNKQLASIIRMSEDELEQKIIGKDGNHSSIKHGVVGTDEHGKPIQGLKMSVGNTASDVEPTTYHYRVRLPESSVEVSPDEVKIKGDKITFGNDVKIARYEAVIDKLEQRVSELEEELFTPCEEESNVSYQAVLGGHGLLADKITTDKSPVLQGAIGTENFSFPSTFEEYNNLYKSTCDLVNKLDTDNLEKLNVIWSGSYMYDMKDFHSLVAQLFVIQEAHKRKGGN